MARDPARPPPPGPRAQPFRAAATAARRPPDAGDARPDRNPSIKPPDGIDRAATVDGLKREPRQRGARREELAPEALRSRLHAPAPSTAAAATRSPGRTMPEPTTTRPKGKHP